MNIPTAFLVSKRVIVGVCKCLFLLYKSIIVFYFQKSQELLCNVISAIASYLRSDIQ